MVKAKSRQDLILSRLILDTFKHNPDSVKTASKQSLEMVKTVQQTPNSEKNSVQIFRQSTEQKRVQAYFI